VVGDFIGALVTQELVITRPDLVTSAVFSAVRLEPTRMNRAVHEEIIARIEQAQDIPPRPLALMRAGQLYAPQRLTDDGHLAAALGTIGVLPTEVAAEAGVLRMSLAYEVQPRRLSTITRPCLVLGFQYDAVTPPHQARQVADLIPGGELTIVPCGHGGAVDDPEAIGSTLVRFFGRERVVDSAGRQCID
jgi:pimeloyl-ACP methyl ester carboxylesterase